MLYKYGKCTCDFFGHFVVILVLFSLYFGGVFNKTVILLVLVEYEMFIASLVGYLPSRAHGIIIN